MRTSGSGNRDVSMMAVPVGILIVYALVSGGGITSTLKMVERNLWALVDSVRMFLS